MPSPESRRTMTTLTAAALLPASLVGGVLVAAPFAGTTTAPLAADSRPVAGSAAPARTAAQPQASPADGVGVGTWATLGLAYLGLAGVGGGVLTVVARRHSR